MPAAPDVICDVQRCGAWCGCNVDASDTVLHDLFRPLVLCRPLGRSPWHFLSTTLLTVARHCIRGSIACQYHTQRASSLAMPRHSYESARSPLLAAASPSTLGTTCLESNADASVILRDKAEFDTTSRMQQANLATKGWRFEVCPCDVVADVNYAPRLEYELYFYFVGSCGTSYKRTVSKSSVRTLLLVCRLSTVCLARTKHVVLTCHSLNVRYLRCVNTWSQSCLCCQSVDHPLTRS